jgi:hypothetical protein
MDEKGFKGSCIVVDMKKRDIVLNFNGEKFDFEAFTVPKYLEGIGLMFNRRSRAKPLLFSFDRTREPIHSCFVFFDFYAVWMDENFKVIEVQRVKPWSVYVNCRREFDYLLEIPIVSGKDFLRRDLVDVLETFK